MENIYGRITRGGRTFENLKTVGETHTGLSGEFESVRTYDDAIITDRCAIVRKYASAEDVEGKCYDWYEITDHNRVIDQSPRVDTLKGQLADATEALKIRGVTLDEERTEGIAK